MAGRYQQRYGIEFVLPSPGLPGSDRGLPPLAHSLPLLMKNNGYATALIGKWHLGYTPAFSPSAHGFEYFFGFKSPAIDYFTHFSTRPSEGAQFASGQPDLWENETLINQEGYMTDLITQKTVEFINANAGRPFFVQVAFNAPHSPTQSPAAQASASTQGSATRADYVAVMERVDRGVGEILEALRTHSLEDETIVIFTNDNGGIGLSNSAPLFHRKFSAWEGGIRVPAIIRWPGRIPGGTVSEQVGITMDLTTSILASTSTPVPPEADLEGIDLFSLLKARSPVVDRTLFWRTGGPSPVNMNQKAVRRGDWKLIIDGAVTRILLFNVKDDPSEREDWFSRRPDLVRELRQLLADWEQDVDADAKAFTATPR